jgi:hypothetical protein
MADNIKQRDIERAQNKSYNTDSTDTKKFKGKRRNSFDKDAANSK